MKPAQFAEEMRAAIDYAVLAHSHHPKSRRNAIRFWDNTTPYAIHPIWCAMTLLSETALPTEIRYLGYQALLWHDLLEDTLLSLPPETDERVLELVQEMTFNSFAHELEAVWTRSETARLLKLYDKVSTLLDAFWMGDDKWNQFVAYTLQLVDFASLRYGELNIIKIARVIAVPRA